MHCLGQTFSQAQQPQQSFLSLISIILILFLQSAKAKNKMTNEIKETLRTLQVFYDGFCKPFD